MPKYLAFVLAGALAVFGLAAMILVPNLKPYDLEKSQKEHDALVAKVEANEKPGLFAMMMSKVGTNLELARSQYLGEHMPATPKGWKIEKTNHAEIIAFTVDYELEMDLNDRSSVRRLSGWGSTTGARSTDVKYTKGDKVIFVRMTGRQRTKEDAMGAYHSRLFIGARGETVEGFELAGLTWERYDYPDRDLLNMVAPVGHDTAVGVFTNASLDEVFDLFQGMDLMAFAAVRGLDKNGNPPTGDDVATYVNAATRDVRPDVELRAPGENFVSDLDTSEDEETANSSGSSAKKKPKNLLAALLAGKDSEDEDAEAQQEAEKPKAGAGAFERKSGSFTSACDRSNGAKFCKVGE